MKHFFALLFGLYSQWVFASAAPLEVLVAVDLECPFSRKALSETVPKLEKEFEGKVVFSTRPYPLEFHNEARKAAKADLCAGEQGYRASYQSLLLKRSVLGPLDVQQVASELDTRHGVRGQPQAGAGTFSLARFESCLEDSKIDQQIKDTMAELTKRGVSATPTFLFPGKVVGGNNPEGIAKAIREALSL